MADLDVLGRPPKTHRPGRLPRLPRAGRAGRDPDRPFLGRLRAEEPSHQADRVSQDADRRRAARRTGVLDREHRREHRARLSVRPGSRNRRGSSSSRKGGTWERSARRARPKNTASPPTALATTRCRRRSISRRATYRPAKSTAQLDTGIYVNNLWYLNYSDRPAGRITGMTRFATLWVEEGPRRRTAQCDALRRDHLSHARREPARFDARARLHSR